MTTAVGGYRLSEILGSVSKHTLSEQVVEMLKRFIILEELQEGDRLPSERQLVATLGISHLVVREALATLAAEGIIVKKHGRGTFVTDFERGRIQSELIVPSVRFSEATNLHLVRCTIEIGIMPILVERVTDDALEMLQDSIYAQWELYHKGASISPEDLRFHRALLKATNSQSLQHFDDVITASVRRIVYSKPSVLRRNIKGTSDFITEHQAIVDALRERDADKATRAMRVHIEEYYTQESTPAVSKSANGHKVLVTANT